MKRIDPIFIEGISAKAIGRGTVKQTCFDDEGNPVHIIIHDVLYCPDLGHRKDTPRRLLAYSKLEDRGISLQLSSHTKMLVMANSAKIPLIRTGNLYFLEAYSTEEGYNVVTTTPPTTRRLELLWHQRLAHINGQKLNDIVDYVGIHLDKRQVDFCSNCAYAKAHVQPKSTLTHPKPETVMHMVGIDIFEMRTVSLQGHRYVFGAADYAGPFVWLKFMEHKSDAPIALRKLIQFANNHDHPIKIVRMDNDSVFLGAEFSNILNEANIEVQLPAPYSQWQNGLIERSWRSISEAAQAMLSTSCLGKEF